VLSSYSVVAAVVVFLVELAFVLGFICLDLLCERNLPKKGCWVFPHLGFSQDKSLVFFLSLIYAATAQYMIYIYIYILLLLNTSVFLLHYH
jgi:hypothetical protein